MSYLHVFCFKITNYVPCKLNTYLYFTGNGDLSKPANGPLELLVPHPFQAAGGPSLTIETSKAGICES